MSDQNGTGSQENNPGGYSPEYIKELREEAAGWRTKFRETETQLSSLKEELGTIEKYSKVLDELDARGLEIEPSWLDVKDGEEISAAVDRFVQKYPQFGGKPTSQPTTKPQPPERKNTNAPAFIDADYSSVKKDPVARSKIRDMYRSMLTQGSIQ
jgi:hypothetical protein